MGPWGPVIRAIHNFLGIWSNSGKVMITYVFWHENGGIDGICAFLHFLSKTGWQKYSAWVPGDPMLSCFYRVMPLSEETHIFWTRPLHHSVFFVKQYANLIYVKEK